METTSYSQSCVNFRILLTIDAGVIRVPEGMRLGSVWPVHSTFTLVPPISSTSTLGGFGSLRGVERREAVRVALRELVPFDLPRAPRLFAPLLALLCEVLDTAIITSRRLDARRMPA